MDDEIRESLRRGDHRKAAHLLMRSGRLGEALDLLEARGLNGDPSALELLVEVLRPESNRWAHLTRLQRLARRGCGDADTLFREWFPGPIFAWDDNWRGGHYELAIALGRNPDARIVAALDALWSHPRLHGCYLERGREPLDQDRVAPSLDGNYGIACLPNGAHVACCCIVIDIEAELTWLLLCIPYSALGDAYPGGPSFAWPPRHTARVWQEALDEWFADIGRHLYERVPFAFAAMGHEVMDDFKPEEVLASGPPKERTCSFLWPTDGRLDYRPVTEWGTLL